MVHDIMPWDILQCKSFLGKLSQHRLQERNIFNPVTKMELKAQVYNPTFKLSDRVFMSNLCAPTTVIKYQNIFHSSVLDLTKVFKMNFTKHYVF